MKSSSPLPMSRIAFPVTSRVSLLTFTDTFSSQLWFMRATEATKPKPANPGRTGKVDKRSATCTRFTQPGSRCDCSCAGTSPATSSSEASPVSSELSGLVGLCCSWSASRAQRTEILRKSVSARTGIAWARSMPSNGFGRSKSLETRSSIPTMQA
eukprot:CAMPEP_0178388988 /NCGR_PEP_ID=MMETSP0689_2-20121128/9877_1 /TAXON_ID=160604 /ORGANISM="Amphidinium massartii, Strain CS-259" /LENGTH=154 /DNA_ID=CAMNT_0020009409 /DNA_START=132 /DNA_END=596 /DNA_ORIENTATION=-